MSLFACTPRIYPRTGEVLPRGFGGGIQLNTLEIKPQHVGHTDRSTTDATVGFFPDAQGALRFGAGACEIGMSYQPPVIALAEVRCGLLQQRWGHPVSIAFSGGAGGTKLLLSPGAAPQARIGIDMSLRFGSIIPLIDVYLSTSAQTHAVTTSFADWAMAERQELRLTIPIGASFEHVDKTTTTFSLGIVPFFVLAHGRDELDSPQTVRHHTDGGFSVTLGADWR